MFVVKNRRMAKRIQLGDAISMKVIMTKLKSLKKHPGLTREQEKAVRDYYYPFKVSTLLHREMLDVTGEFRPEYLPSEMFYAYLDGRFNSRERSVGLENKCLFPKLYPGIPQPASVAYRMNGFWLSPDYAPMEWEEVLSAVEQKDELFIKQADDSFGGAGVRHLSAKKSGGSLRGAFADAVNEMRGDVIVQRAIRQHADIAAINPSSVNTFRICSMLTEGGVRLLGAILRFASGDQSVDNFTSGGLACGVDENGRLKKFAYSSTGRFEVHPSSGIRFEGYQLPSFDKAAALVKKAHPMLPYFRLVGWDIAISEDGEPVMIEANLCSLGIAAIQMVCGPLFGADTKRIVTEALEGTDYPVYNKKRRKNQ